MTKDPVTIKEASRLLGVGVQTIRKWEREGRIKAVRFPGGWRRFYLADIETCRRRLEGGE